MAARNHQRAQFLEILGQVMRAHHIRRLERQGQIRKLRSKLYARLGSRCACLRALSLRKCQSRRGLVHIQVRGVA